MASNEVAKAFVTIIPSMQGAQKTISDELTGAASKAGDKAGKIAGDATGESFSGGIAAKAGIIGGAVSAIAGKALDAIASLGSEMIETSDATDKFKSTLEFAGLDTGEIERVTASTRKYADETVYDLATIQNATAQLAANGVANYDKLVEASGNLNAIAGGNADTFKSVTMVLTQTAGAGKLTTENWNQLAEAIPGAAGVLMDAMKDAGAYTGNFRDAMADGQITADEFNDALLAIGFDETAVKAATSTETIEGAVGNLQASIVGIGSDLLTALKPAITGIISGFSNALTTASDAVKGFGEQAVSAFEQIAQSNAGKTIQLSISAIGEAFSQAGADASEAFAEAFSDVGVDTSQITDVIDEVVDKAASLAVQLAQSIGQFLTSIDWTSIAEGARQAFDMISQVAGAIFDAYLNFVKIDIQVSTSIISQVFSTLWSVIQQLASVLGTTLAPLIQKIFPIWQSALQGVWTVFGNILTLVGNFVSAVMPGLQAGLSGIISGLQPLLSGVSNLVSALLDVLMPLLNQLYDFWTSTLYPALSDAMTQIGDALGGALEAFGNYVGQISSLIGGFIDAIAEVISTLKPIIEPIFSGILTAWQDTWSAVVEMITGVVSSIGNIISTIYNTAANVLGKIKNIFSTIFNGIKTFIKQIISGDINGAIQTIKNTFSSVMNNVKSIASTIWGGIKGVFTNAVSGIKSVFKGLATALTTPFRSAFNAIKNLWNSTIGGFSFTLPSWIPGVGGAGFTIPYLASGGDIVSGGTVIVGEAGPEMLTLPRGARVTPLSEESSNSTEDIVSVIVWLARQLPGIISEAQGDGLSERDFARLVRRFA